MNKVFLFIMLFVSICKTVNAYYEDKKVIFTWDANEEPVEGYKLFVRPSGASYDYNAEPSDPNDPFSEGLVYVIQPHSYPKFQLTISSQWQERYFSDGCEDIHFVVRAFIGDLESEDSDEVMLSKNQLACQSYCEDCDDDKGQYDVGSNPSDSYHGSGGGGCFIGATTTGWMKEILNRFRKPITTLKIRKKVK